MRVGEHIRSRSREFQGPFSNYGLGQAGQVPPSQVPKSFRVYASTTDAEVEYLLHLPYRSGKRRMLGDSQHGPTYVVPY